MTKISRPVLVAAGMDWLFGYPVILIESNRQSLLGAIDNLKQCFSLYHYSSGCRNHSNS